MKKLLLLNFLVASLLSCTNTEKKTHATPTDSTENAVVAEETHKDLYGIWVGDFEPIDIKENAENVQTNKITLVLKSITTGDDVIAQSVVAGNSRPLNGKIVALNSKLSFVLDEPGDDKFDGRFEFELKGDTLVGFWNAYKNTLDVTKRSFKLLKKSFTYNANLMLSKDGDYTDWYGKKVKKVTDTVDGITETYENEFYRSASKAVYELNASTANLTEKDLKNLRKLDLQILRNTIFARHGYTFKKKNYRQFFNPVEWYVPVTNNVDGQLTNIEKKNIKLLERFEKYAEDNYDTFGR